MRYSNNSNNNNKRRSLRDLLPFSRKKSNSDKIEKYLDNCFQHPIIGISSILKDFTSVQRDEDSFITSQLTSTTLTPTLHEIKGSNNNNNNNNNQPIYLLPPIKTTPVVTSIAPIISPESVIQIEKHDAFTINDFNLLKVLGKGCMGKVCNINATSYSIIVILILLLI
jgi:hypothetical protein